MGVPNTFGNATSTIPLINLDQNFNTPVTIGSTSVGLGNTVTSLTGLGNVGMSNAVTTHLLIGPGYNISVAAQSTNYAIDSVANISGKLLILSWDGADGFALCYCSNGGGGIVTTIGSSNALGGTNAFDTTNSFSSNGGNGLALVTAGGLAYIQSKSSGYTGPANIATFTVS